MRGSFCYMANLSARGGAIAAASNLSPLAHARSAFLFDLPRPVLPEGRSIEVELDKRGDGIVRCAKLDGRPWMCMTIQTI